MDGPAQAERENIHLSFLSVRFEPSVDGWMDVNHFGEDVYSLFSMQI